MENIQEYGINISFDNSIFKKITEFERRVDKMKRKLEKGFNIPAPTFLPPTTLTKSSRGQAPDLMGPSPDKGFRKGRQVDTIRFQREEKKRLKEEADLLKKQDLINKSRRRQAVDDLTSPSGAGKAKHSTLAEMMREEDKREKKTLSFLSQQRFNTEAITDEQRKTWKMALKASKTEEQMLKTKQLMVKQAVKLNQEHREAVKRLKKQHFLMQRMESSSKQMAGNMVSAFALGAVGTGIVTTGQNFEAINNTMLAVSENSEEAGKRMQFVRDESFRLGLGLKESAKQFAKMLSARGTMSLEGTKEAFLGISEMSTLLGLSTVESGRAMTALTQSMSKGQIMA